MIHDTDDASVEAPPRPRLRPRSRMATLRRIREEIVPLYLDPVPTIEVLREMFARAGIPRMKAGSPLRRGGGPIYYNTDAVERYFRKRTIFT